MSKVADDINNLYRMTDGRWLNGKAGQLNCIVTILTWGNASEKKSAIFLQDRHIIANTQKDRIQDYISRSFSRVLC